MNELRWILIGFGIVLLAGIYLWGRRGSAAGSEDVALRSSSEPVLQPHGFTDVRREPALHEPALHFEGAEDPAEEPPEVASRQVEQADDYEVTTAHPVPDFRRGRVEPTLGSDTVTEALPVSPAQTYPAQIYPPQTYPPQTRPATTHLAPTQVTPTQATAAEPTPAPTLSSSDTPPPRRSSVRKILSLRLSLAPQRVEGGKLQEVLQEELLTHGKYQIFHRLHSDGQSIFSIASMVEPGSFELETMGETLYPGITLFAQLPGPVPGMHALNEMVACARRLHQALGGVLQDERGVPLTVHRIERMRQEVREFERPQSASTRSNASKSEGWQE